MRILHLINRYWPAQSGSEIHFGELSARLADDGHSVRVATTTALDYEALSDPHGRQLSLRKEAHRKVEIWRFPVRHLPGAPKSHAALQRLLMLLSRHTPISADTLSRLSHSGLRIPDFYRWLRRTEEPFDLIAGMNLLFHPILEAGSAMAMRLKIPFVAYPILHLGAGEKPGEGFPGPFYSGRHQLALLARCAAVVAQTETEKRFLEEHGVASNRIRVVGPGINPAEVTGGDGKRFRCKYGLQGPVVSFLSSMVFDKGVMHLIEAVRRLWEEGSPVELVLAGTMFDSFRTWWSRIPPETCRRIRLLGSIREEEKRDLLAASEIVAIPSRTDSFGLVYLEAWLYRKPVIGARAWGIDDVITDGRDGLLVEFGNEKSLSEAIATLAQNPSLRESMGFAGYRKVLEHHTWDRKYAMIRDLYHGLTDPDRQTPSRAISR